MDHKAIREKFLKFFQDRGHAIVPSSSLLPDDKSVLFTTAGMQQFKKYYLETDSPYGNRVASIQKSIRTTDIDQVGDESHLTFFEMLGNFSFKFPEGEDSYFKEEAIKLGYEFIVKELNIPLERIKISVFGGNDQNNIPKDNESLEIWKSLGISEDKIIFGDINDNFWGPTGNQGPCGPTTEIYINGIEVWNIVFNEYLSDTSREELLKGKTNLTALPKKGVDTGMGLERLAMVLQNKKNVFETDLFEPIMKNLASHYSDREKRIIGDHARASIFLISDGVRPSNKEQGYVLRRLLRRSFVYMASAENLDYSIFNKIIEEYSSFYGNLDDKVITEVIKEEELKFSKTIVAGLKEIDKLNEIDSRKAFDLFQSFGLPYEIIKEFGKEKTKNLTYESFDEEFKKHQEKSRIGADKKFL